MNMFVLKSQHLLLFLASVLSVICYVENATAGRCDQDEFRCRRGECIPDIWKCDGEPDCSNKRDERNCPNFSCGEHEHVCNDSGVKHCIPIIYRCDNDSDCEDNSDEDPAICRAPRT